MEKTKLFSMQVVRYLTVGVVSLSADYLLLVALHYGLHVELWLATTVAFFAGLLVNFMLNKYWSFNADHGVRQSVRQAVLYGTLVLFNLVFTNVFIITSDSMGVEPIITKPIATAMIALWNFLLYKKIIFKSKD